MAKRKHGFSVNQKSPTSGRNSFWQGYARADDMKMRKPKGMRMVRPISYRHKKSVRRRTRRSR